MSQISPERIEAMPSRAVADNRNSETSVRTRGECA